MNRSKKKRMEKEENSSAKKMRRGGTLRQIVLVDIKSIVTSSKARNL